MDFAVGGQAFEPTARSGRFAVIGIIAEKFAERLRRVLVTVAIAMTFLLSTYGAHGVQGLIAVYGGYPGGFVNWRLNPGRVNYALITVVNWLTYFAVAEVVSAIFKRSAHQHS